jgi:hypothetical protein
MDFGNSAGVLRTQQITKTALGLAMNALRLEKSSSHLGLQRALAEHAEFWVEST